MSMCCATDIFGIKIAYLLTHLLTYCYVAIIMPRYCSQLASACNENSKNRVTRFLASPTRERGSESFGPDPILRVAQAKTGIKSESRKVELECDSSPSPESEYYKSVISTANILTAPDSRPHPLRFIPVPQTLHGKVLILV